MSDVHGRILDISITTGAATSDCLAFEIISPTSINNYYSPTTSLSRRLNCSPLHTPSYPALHLSYHHTIHLSLLSTCCSAHHSRAQPAHMATTEASSSPVSTGGRWFQKHSTSSCSPQSLRSPLATTKIVDGLHQHNNFISTLALLPPAPISKNRWNPCGTIKPSNTMIKPVHRVAKEVIELKFMPKVQQVWAFATKK